MKQRSIYRKKTIKENPQFSKVKSKKKLISWLMRQYFNPAKHSESPWYKSSVTSGNVLKYVSNPLNRFPLTPVKIVDMFNCIQSFKKNLKKSEKELGPDLGLTKSELLKLRAPASVPSVKYQTGETTLREVGQALGGLTPTMINKLVTSGMGKITKMSKGVPLDELAGPAADDLNKTIMDCRVVAALEYAEALKDSKGRIKNFIAGLVKKRAMKASDVKLMTDKEVVSLSLMYSKSQGEIVQLLLRDINQDNNLFKSYQSVVSRKAFPEKKCGRPKKNIEATEDHV